jgi:hypothetical protein
MDKTSIAQKDINPTVDTERSLHNLIHFIDWSSNI